MTSLRWLVLFAFLSIVGAGVAQQAGPDERTVRVAERYRSMLLTNPVDGPALDRLWKSYEERGAAGRLVEEFRALADAPHPALGPVLVYGHLLRRAGRPDEASAVYERAEGIDPTSPLPTLARADLALSRSHGEEAAGLFVRALEKLPTEDRRRPEVLRQLGAAWMSAGQPAKAAESWERIVAQDPTNLELRRRLAESYERAGSSEHALVHYGYMEAHAEPAERAVACRDLARLHETRGEFDAARDALDRGLALTSSDNWLHRELETRLIRLFQRAGRVPELMDRWRAAAEMAPHDPEGYLRLADLAEAQGDTAGERDALEHLVALAPNDDDYTRKLARRRAAEDGDRAVAGILYDRLLAAHPDDLDLMFARAEIDLQLGRPDDAAARIEARIARNPVDESVATSALAFFLEHHLVGPAEKSLRAGVMRRPADAEPALALAKFLLSQRRTDEARAVLAQWTRQPGDVAVRAARWTKAAEIFRDQNLAADALQAWQEAATLEPRNSAPLCAAGDFLLARGDATGASERFERAGAVAIGTDRANADRKLFAALQSMDDPGEGRVQSFVIPGLPREGVAPRVGPRVKAQLAKLEKTAADLPDGEHFLRLARWQSWAGSPDVALESATRAIAAEPANLAARELAVSLAVDLRRPAEAEVQLQALTEQDPAHKNDHLRQLANLKMDGGDVEAALSIFTQLQQDDPRARGPLADLALAQQRADRWYDALTTWERADALPGGTPAQRDEVRRPLLAAYDHVGQFSREAEVLRAAVDAQTELAQKTDLFHQLATVWHRHDLGSDLRDEYEKRLASHPDDYFLLTALAELRREEGRDADAFALLRRAYFSAPDPARSLADLVDGAEQLGDDAEAVVQQRRLVALPRQATAVNLEKLAVLAEADADRSVAGRTWDDAVAKFPRDTTVLGHAAEFFARDGRADRARELLRQLVAVDETAGSRRLELAALEAQAGDVGAAAAEYERLLAQTAPETKGEPLCLPAELATRADAATPFAPAGTGSPSLAGRTGRPGATESAITEERRLRLRAIEGTSRLLFPAGGSPLVLDVPQLAWVQRWQQAAAAGASSEPLAAFYSAGLRDRTLDLLAGWLPPDAPAADPITGVFLSAGLRLGGYQRLAKWAWHPSDPRLAGPRAQQLLRALVGFLQADGKPRPGMVAELFPAEVQGQEVRWEAAQNGFALNHRYAEAAELGEQVVATARTARSGYAVATAEWELYAGNRDRARAVLRQALDDPDATGLELGDPLFLALRSYYALLPPEERAAFVARRLGRRELQGRPVESLLESILLHGVSGATDAARHDLDQLLGLRLVSSTPTELSADIRRWTYLLGCGDQLQKWNLPLLAIHLWKRALAEEGAFDQQVGEVDGTVSEMHSRLLLAEVGTAEDPQQARERLEEFLSEQPEPAVINSLAILLGNEGERAAAAQLYETLYRIDPKSTDFWPNLQRFYAAGNDEGASEALLGQLLAGGRPLPPGVTPADLVCQIAALHEKQGDVAGAIRRLAHARQSDPGAWAVLVQLAQTDERASRWDDAISAWREALPRDVDHAARLGLAAAQAHLGDRTAAVETLRAGLSDGPDPGGADLTIRLTQTLLEDHRVNDARQLADALTARGDLEPLPAIGAAFAAAGEHDAARSLLLAGVRRAREPAARFHLQQALVEQAAVPPADPADFERQMGRLDRFAQASDALRTEYDDLLYPLAHQRGAEAWLERELQRRWQHGRGDPAAGVRLSGLFIQEHRDDALREAVQTIDGRADLPEDLLYRLATSLIESDHAPLALGLCERLARRYAQKPEYLMARARALWKSGRPAEANLCLRTLADWTVFQGNKLRPIADFYLQEGETAQAAQYLKRIVAEDPAANHDPRAWLQLAQIALDENRVADAERLLRVVYARPGTGDLGPLVRLLKITGQLEGNSALAMSAPDFPLSFERRARLLAAVRDELVKTGRAEDGRRLLELHAEFFAAIPTLAGELARGATRATARTIAECLERAVNQRQPVAAELSRALAGLYVQWATWDANDPAARGVALAHLTRAFELEPDDPATACPLARAYVQQGRSEQAAKTLAAFLGPDALPAEHVEAYQILAGF